MSDIFKYEEIAGSIRRAVAEGTLVPGDRVCSLRETCRRHRVSLVTALRAFTQLEEEGILTSREKYGFYIAERTEEALLPRMHRDSGNPKAASADDFLGEIFALHTPDSRPETFTQGSPSPALLPQAALARAMRRILLEEPDINTAYGSPRGEEKLRRLIAKRFMAFGRPTSPDSVLITNGAMHALSLALEMLAGPGDVVAVETPVFPGTLRLLALRKYRIIQIPSSPTYGLDLPSFEKIAGRKPPSCLITSPNFNNPAGGLMPDGNKDKLAELSWKYGVPVIEDDVFGDLHFGPLRPASLAKFDRRGTVLHIGSFSKTLGPGLRTGYMISERHADRATALKMSSTMGTPLLQQKAAAELAGSIKYDRHLRIMRTTFARNMAVLPPLMREYMPDARFSVPKGGFSMWVEIPNGKDLLPKAIRAMRERILFIPGEAFACGGLYRNYFRICTAGNTSPETARQAVKKLADLLS